MNQLKLNPWGWGENPTQIIIDRKLFDLGGLRTQVINGVSASSAHLGCSLVMLLNLLLHIDFLAIAVTWPVMLSFNYIW